MERRTDTGCELPGMGQNSPMPEVAVVRSVEEQVAQLMQDMARLYQCVDDQQRQIDKLEQQLMKSEGDKTLLKNLLAQYVSTSMTMPQQAPAVVMPEEEAVAEESPLMAYTKLFVFSLRTDVRRSNLLVRMLREQLMPVAQSLERNTIRWCHVWKVMYDDQLLIEKVNKKAFGRFLRDILGKGFNAENLRRASSGDDLKGTNFHTWAENNTDKNLCLEVEHMFIQAGIIEKAVL